MKKLYHALTPFVFAVSLFACTLFASTTVLGQASTAASLNEAGARADAMRPDVISSLSALPEADTLIYVNPQRILNEVLPKFMPPKDLEDMRKGFEEARKHAGIDPTKVDYIVIAVRFKKPTADLNFQAPEFLAVAGGDFSADSLLMLARMASQGKLRDEKYGARTLGLMTVDPLVKMAEQNPFLKSFTEVGIVPLNANTIAVGTPGYLRAASDAADGKERISTDTLNSLVRDPNVLLSIAGTPWHSFAKSFGMLGTEANARAARCESKMGDFYAALTMDGNNFMLRGAMNEDNPDTAKIVGKLFATLLAGATSTIKDPAAQNIFRNVAITAEGDEVRLSANFPQQMVMNLLQQHMKKPETTPLTPEKPGAKPRRTRRRSKA